MGNDVLKNIRESAPDKIVLSIKSLLLRHIGEYLSKEKIAELIWATPCSFDSKGIPHYVNATRDRQIRDSVSTLVTQGEGIVTNTADGGFKYAQNEAEIDQNISDLSDRIDKLMARRDGLYLARKKMFNKTAKASRCQDALFSPVEMNSLQKKYDDFS
jgi:hypothetical protein